MDAKKELAKQKIEDLIHNVDPLQQAYSMLFLADNDELEERAIELINKHSFDITGKLQEIKDLL